MYINHKELDQYWIFDVEADGLLDTIKNVWCVVAKNVATKEVVKLTAYADIRNFFNRQDCIFVGHNILSYDVPALNRVCGTSIPYDRCVDSLVLSYLYHPTMPNGHSVDAYGERFGIPKDHFSDFTRYSTELLERCVRDVDIQLRIFTTLTKKMRLVGFSEASCKLEHDIHIVIDEQMENGFEFNQQGADQLYARLRGLESDYERSIQALFPSQLHEMGTYRRRTKKDGSDWGSFLRHREQFPELRDNGDGTYSTLDWQEFNIGSPKQRLDKLLSLGFVPTKLTKGGNPSVDEDSLVDFAKESGIEEVKAIADWLVVNSRAGMVNSWSDCSNRLGDSRIHGRVFSCGANSRRMTHSGPNTANIPSNEAKYGEECRQLWIARSGRVLVGYDAKSAQMRCFAHYLPNPDDGRRFYTDGHDPHQENADLIGIKRKPIKNVFYANMFGAYPPKLATTAGRTGTKRELEQYGVWVRDELYRVTPGLEAATKSARDEASATSEGWMRCLDGGYVRCPGQHAALNYRIQPAEAVLLKTASVYIKQRSGSFDQLKVGDIHDEGQHDVDPRQAQDFGKLCVQALRDAGETYNLRVPFDGDFKVGKTWAETH